MRERERDKSKERKRSRKRLREGGMITVNPNPNPSKERKTARKKLRGGGMLLVFGVEEGLERDRNKASWKERTREVEERRRSRGEEGNLSIERNEFRVYHVWSLGLGVRLRSG